MAINRITSTFVFFLFISITLGACADKTGRETIFTEMYPLHEMNTKIRFWHPTRDDREFKPCEFNDLTLENFSDSKVVFPNDYGLRIYTFDQGENMWLEIQNSAKYIPEGNRQISPKGLANPFGVTGIDFVPQVLDCEQAIEIRVVVVGEVYEGDTPTGVSAGAYIDVTLHP